MNWLFCGKIRLFKYSILIRIINQTETGLKMKAKSPISTKWRITMMFLFLISFGRVQAQQATEVVIVDRNYADKASVIAAMPASANYLELENAENPWRTIREFLMKHEAGVIHLFTNTRSAGIELDGQYYDVSRLSEEFELAMFEGLYQGEHLQMLIYDCTLAQSASGKEFMGQLGQLTYMNVAASTSCDSIWDAAFTFDYATMPKAVASSILNR